ncbi:hypothetical protein DJ93_2950 [Bacillus clarus]|uniref:Uncharacterized protein n=1 Tax=Bacillus clarus TaxID=2338372 RepID=A0A090YP37_9BACI|nr:hypothetical protein DJ93_2950 [Bacillus clarus]
MITIMTIRTATRFMLWMRTALLLTAIFIIVVLFIVTHDESPPVPFYYGTETYFSLRELLSLVR